MAEGGKIILNQSDSRVEEEGAVDEGFVHEVPGRGNFLLSDPSNPPKYRH